MGLWTFLAICVVCGTISKVAVAKVKSRDSRKYGSDDTRTMQEIHRNLLRMEERLEALETLIVDRPSRRYASSEFE